MNMLKLALVSATLVGMGFLSNAHAADNVNFDVKIKINSACNIDLVAPTDVDFGAFASTQTAAATADGALNVTCTKKTPYTIGLSAGNGTNATVTSRAMKAVAAGNTDEVPYELFRDAARSANWGTALADRYSGTGTGANQVIPVYGRVSSFNYAAGDYKDTITATVYF